MIGKVLGHKSPTATQIYSRFTHDPLRQAMEKAQADMLVAAGLMPDRKNPRGPAGALEVCFVRPGIRFIMTK